MKQKYSKPVYSIVGLLIAVFAGSASADNLNFQDTPLFVTTSARPNVMIQFDNSGSMDNVIFEAGYDPAVTYPDWGQGRHLHFTDFDNSIFGTPRADYCEPDADHPCDPVYVNAQFPFPYCDPFDGNDDEDNDGDTDPPCVPVYVGGWSGSDGNVHIDQLSSCHPNDSSASWRYGRKGDEHVCLKLPDPVGNTGDDTRFSGNYLNYLFETYGTTTSDAGDQIPYVEPDTPAQRDIQGLVTNDYRLQVAKDVIADLIQDNKNLRLGLASFHSPTGSGDTFDGAPGGKIDRACGAATADLLSTVDGYDSDSNTPLAETYYEVTRYFRGLAGHFNADTYTSPIQYRCQQNFAIVITDGFPTYDGEFPNDDPDDVAESNASLPNWDGLSPATSSTDYPNFAQYSDGFDSANANSTQGEGRSLFLDDLAKFGFDTDLRKSGNDLAGRSFQDPEFEVQNLVTYTVGFTLDNNMLEDAAEYGDGLYFTADNAAELSEALTNALDDIIERTSSAASVALSSSFLITNTDVYLSQFNSGTWTGQLLARPISTGDNSNSCNSQPIGTICDPVWDASEQIPAENSRVIYSFNDSSRLGITFERSGMSTAQRALFGADQAEQEALIDYIRGNQALEDNANGFRERNSLLGDMIHSDPYYIGVPPFDYSFGDYATFRFNKQNRRPMVYIGANDGMLHGFDAETGVERIAYVPSEVYANLDELSDPDYSHFYYVDSSPTVGDVQLGASNTWATVLAGGLRTGGQGMFVLDITNPGNKQNHDVNLPSVPDEFTTARAGQQVLWEFNDSDDTDLGYTFSQPSLVRVRYGDADTLKWVAVFGNGYNSHEADGAQGSGQSGMFMLRLDGPTGSSNTWQGGGVDYYEFLTGHGTVGDPNGMSTPAPIDVDGDAVVDYIYAGDLEGNLWRFEDSGTGTWVIGNSGNPIFTATDSGGTAQPITVRPEVGKKKNGPGVLVYVGTGKYLEPGDNDPTGAQTQSFYAIWDELDGTALSLTRSDLLEQQILAEVDNTANDCDENETCFRITTDNTITTESGWFMDLVNMNPAQNASLDNKGEKVVADPILRQGRIIFTTLQPEPDPCKFGGSGWLMELEAQNGKRLNTTPFDVDEDGNFTPSDKLQYSNNGGTTMQDAAYASGIRSALGIIAQPTILGLVESDREFKVLSGTGGTGTLAESTSGEFGRITWRELRRD